MFSGTGQRKTPKSQWPAPRHREGGAPAPQRAAAVPLRAERRRRIHLTSVLPLPLGVTDGAGEILDANPALAGPLGIAPGRLAGKPLSVYDHPGDLPVSRLTLRCLISGHVTEHRSTVHLRPRERDEDRAVSLFGSPDTDADRGGVRLLWVLLSAAQPPDDVRGIAAPLSLSAAADTPAVVSDSPRAAAPGREDLLLAVPGRAELLTAAVGEPPARMLGRRVGKGRRVAGLRDEAAVLGPGPVCQASPGRRQVGFTAAHGPPGAWSGSPPPRPSPAGARAAFRPVAVQDAAGLRHGFRAWVPAPGSHGGRAARVRGAGLRADAGVS